MSTDLERKLYAALKRISSYDAPEKLKRRAQKEYGLSEEEAIEFAYENVIEEARSALKGIRRPKPLSAMGGA